MTDNRTPSAPGPPRAAWPPPDAAPRDLRRPGGWPRDLRPPHGEPRDPTPHAGAPRAPRSPDERPPDQPVHSSRSRAGRGHRRRRLLAVVGGLALAVLLAPTPLVRPLADRAARGYQGRCATFTGVDADPGAWPVVARAAMGRLRGVATHADRVAFDNGAVFHDVDVSADHVDGPPLAFGLRSGDARIRGGRSSATVHLDDLERALAAEGVTVDLRSDAGALVADVEIPVIGVVPTAVEVVAADGDLELRFAPYDAFPLPPLRIALPDPVELQEVHVGAAGIRVSSRVEGTLPAGEWGCDPAPGAP